MVGGGKKASKNANQNQNPEVEERNRLKRRAISGGVLSEKRAGPLKNALGPSNILLKQHGKDIVMRKSQRKNRYLFSFPGLLGPISGGKLGELTNLSTKNPVLYLDFPQGQMKLFGTIVYPKNRYLTLQFPKGSKSVTCEDYFDNMIVFSDAWWIGKKDENPDELRLDFPKELNLDQHADYDFNGGAGAANGEKGVKKSVVKSIELDSPEDDQANYSSDSQDNLKELSEATPTRRSARTGGKTFNFAEASSGDDFIGNGAETSEEEEEKVGTETTTGNLSLKKKKKLFHIDNQDTAKDVTVSEKIKQTIKTKKSSHKNQASLVQTTLSSLYKKVDEKNVVSGDSVKSHGKKSNSHASGASTSRKRPANLALSDESDPISSFQAEDDVIEELSSTSEDKDASDEDWTA